MASFRSLSVLSAPRTQTYALIYGHIDSVDKILARFADAGEFDELETVWFLIALVFRTTCHEIKCSLHHRQSHRRRAE